MNKELKELLEICEESRHKIIEFRYSKFNECYMATVEGNELGDRYIIAYQDENWVTE